MILTRAPLRISFFGGGTDLPSHYSKYGGAVLSAGIDKYMHIVLNPTPQDHVKLTYSIIEHVKSYKELKHDIVRSVLSAYGMGRESGLEIGSYADIPTVGTGLGSSSTFAVALIRAVAAMNGYEPPLAAIADSACDIEINWCRSPIGKQDQYAAAYGGVNLFKFNADETVHVKAIPNEHWQGLEENLLLFYTGVTRSANAILQEQNARPNHESLNKMTEQAHLARNYLLYGNYDDFGAMLDDAWKYKRELAPGITNAEIDWHYQAAMNAGALGGKLLGAGGGGYLMFYVPKAIHPEFIDIMSDRGLKHFNFSFSKTGVELLYNDN